DAPPHSRVRRTARAGRRPPERRAPPCRPQSARARAERRGVRAADRDPRPDGLEAGLMRSDWLLFAHILSAMLLFGGVLAVATVSLAAERWAWPDQVPILRALAFRTHLFVVLPGFVAVHVFGDLLANKALKHGNPAWL